MSVRLNKFLAQRGIGARRKCDILIQSGVVRINGEVVTEPGTQVEPDQDRVEVSGRVLPPRSRLLYYLINKPVGVISTLADPQGRRTIRDLLPPGPRVFPVGRLDADTSGLLLLTNDGELAHHLMHPRYGVEKHYRVHADRPPSPAMLRRLKEGIEFEPGIVSAPAQVRVRDETAGDSVIEIAIQEGRYRQVRRMCEAAGLSVHRLHRWAYGPLRLGQLERGMWRELSDDEVSELRAGAARPKARERGGYPARPSGARSGGAERERAPKRFQGERAPEPRPRSGARDWSAIASEAKRRERPGTRGSAPARREGAAPRAAGEGGSASRPFTPRGAAPGSRPARPFAERGAAPGSRPARPFAERGAAPSSRPARPFTPRGAAPGSRPARPFAERGAAPRTRPAPRPSVMRGGARPSRPAPGPFSEREASPRSRAPRSFAERGAGPRPPARSGGSRGRPPFGGPGGRAAASPEFGPRDTRPAGRREARGGGSTRSPRTRDDRRPARRARPAAPPELRLPGRGAGPRIRVANEERRPSARPPGRGLAPRGERAAPPRAAGGAPRAAGRPPRAGGPARPDRAGQKPRRDGGTRPARASGKPPARGSGPRGRR